jgi:hypothetical protein
MGGVLKGHDIYGNAIIINDFGNPNVKPFAEIRLEDFQQARLPNWHYLPTGGRLRKPDPFTIAAIHSSLDRPVPPGPTYNDLIREIWSRGFEVFVVGGTVRDLLGGQEPNDVDIVTTMPIVLLQQFLRSMYRYKPSDNKVRGFIRIGGRPGTHDPFVDLKVFSNSLAGTRDAVFGSDFTLDAAHRDFACNALYYDPCNNIIVDPTAIGLDDAVARRLSVVCSSGDQHQKAQIFIRLVKFVMRGFVVTDSTRVLLVSDLQTAIPVMTESARIEYVRRQVLGKCPSPDLHLETLEKFKGTMISLGLEDAWRIYFEPLEGRILA